MTKTTQKAADNNTWNLVAVQNDLKTRIKEVTLLQKLFDKGSPISEETLNPHLDHSLRSATSLKEQLTHAESKLGSLKGTRENASLPYAVWLI